MMSKRSHRPTRHIITCLAFVFGCFIGVSFTLFWTTNTNASSIYLANLRTHPQQGVPSSGATPITTKSASSGHGGTTRTTRHNWPGIPTGELGHPLVKIGHNFVENAGELLLQHWEEFLEVYANRPDKVNMCGIRFNHAYALWITVKHMKPTTIIESGVNAGQSTYFMRNAATTSTTIYAIDPEDKPICKQGERWIDPTGKTEYLTGQKFKDIEAVDWRHLVEENKIDPNRTLVFLDDHLKVFTRYQKLMEVGFRHIILEDNYKAREGATRDDKGENGIFIINHHTAIINSHLLNHS